MTLFSTGSGNTIYTRVLGIETSRFTHESLHTVYSGKIQYFTLVSAGKLLWNYTPYTQVGKMFYTIFVAFLSVCTVIFIQVGNNVFRQCVGIPMGTDCAPLLANLYLFYFEYRYMLKNNFHMARRFSNTVRYI